MENLKLKLDEFKLTGTYEIEFDSGESIDNWGIVQIVLVNALNDNLGTEMMIKESELYIKIVNDMINSLKENFDIKLKEE